MVRLRTSKLWGGMSIVFVVLALVVLFWFSFPQSTFAACPSADITEDCIVDYQDLGLMAARWLWDHCRGNPVDLNHDCLVDFNDFAVMAAQWLTGDPCAPNDMAYIPGGTFQMGDHFAEGGTDELPVHTVTLNSFYMSKYEITHQQYCDYLNSAYPAQLKVVGGIVYAADDAGNSYPYCDTSTASSPSQINFSDPDFSVNLKDAITDMADHPMVMVSWYGTVAYCNWKSQQEGLESCYDLSTWECDFTKNGFRLPTEAEWEYAARGGEHDPYYRYPWGDTIDGSMDNYWESGDPYETGAYPYTTPVGYYDGGQTPAGADMANGYGLHDAAGNIWEWCNDLYSSSYYSSSPSTNPTGPASGSYRALRGGYWSYHDNRVASRNRTSPGNRRQEGGFRVCVSASSSD